MPKNDIPLPRTWTALTFDLEEATKQFGMDKAYWSAAEEIGHLIFWKHFLKAARDRHMPQGPDAKNFDINQAVDCTRLLLRRPTAECLPYARMALAASETELDFHVALAATKIHHEEGAHIAEHGPWAYLVYGLMDALATHRFERAVKEG